VTYADNPLMDQICKDVIHRGLKCGGAVGKSKKHHQQLIKTTVCAECSLPFITLLNAHIVVSPANIQLGEVAGTVELAPSSEIRGMG
jgi:hypothetical protein